MIIANVALRGMNRHGPELLDWLKCRRPNVVTLQKVGPDEKFPKEAIRAIGYNSEMIGDKAGSTATGVAILSHCDLPAPKVRQGRLPPGTGKGDSGFLTVDIGALSVSSVYVPYPEAVRLDWLNRLRDHIRDEDYHLRDSLLCGDFNAKFMAEVPPSRQGGGYSKAHENALKELMNLGFCDLYRDTHRDHEKYPGNTSNYYEKYPKKGSRLHLILASRSLAQNLRNVWLDCDPIRPREDAPPLMADLDLNV